MTLRSYISFFTIVGALLIAACAPNDALNKSRSVKPLKTTQVKIEYRVDGNDLRPWTITPELKPDTLPVDCTNDKITKVTFVTDIEERSFELKGIEVVRFDIILSDKTRADTKIQCVPPKRRYLGDYTSDRSTAEDMKADILPILRTYYPDTGAGAIVQVIQGDDVLLNEALGYANIEEGIRRTTYQPFDIASISKEFTMVTIVQLAELGKLSLDHKVSQYIPSLKGGADISLRKLLNHTHGLPHYFMSEEYEPTEPLSLDRVVTLLNKMEPRFEPGTQFEYGNTGYYLLARIGEMISKADRETYVRSNLFAPAEILDCGFFAEFENSKSRPKAYLEALGVPRRDAPKYHLSHMSGVGDIVCKSSALRDWHRALVNGTLVSKEALTDILTPTVLPTGESRARALGVMVGDYQGEQYFYNSGDFHTHTRYAYFPGRDIWIVLNTNNTVEYQWNESSIVFAQIMGKILNAQKFRIFDSDVDLNDL